VTNKPTVQYVQISLIAIIAALFLASPFLDMRLWGVSFLKFGGGLHYFILALIAAALVFVLIRARTLREDTITPPEWFLTDTPWLILYTVVGAAILYLLRPDHPFLGDGILRAGEIESGIYISKTEPLSTLLHAGLYHLLNMFGAFEGKTVYSAVSSIAGAVFAVLLIFRWGRNEGGFDARRLTISLTLLSFGSTVLFFGYVESYALSFILASGSLICVYSYLNTGRLFVAGLLLGLLAVAFHMANVVLLPALLFAVYRGWRDERIGSKRYAGAIIALLAVADPVYFALLYTGYGESRALEPASLLVSFDPRSFYHALSREHIADVLNEFLLAVPAAIVMIPLLFVSRSDSESNSGIRILSILVAVPALLLTVLFDPKLGYARDWDLFALPAAMIGIAIVMPASRRSAFGSTIVQAGIALGIVISSAFMLTNKIPSSNVERFDHLLELDRERSPFGRELMTMYFMNNRDIISAQRQLRLALEVDPNKRHYKLLSELMYAVRQYNEAGKEALRSIRLDEDYDEGHYQLAKSLEALQDIPNALYHYSRAIELNPDVPHYRNSYGAILIDQEKYVEAESQLAEAVSLKPESAVYLNNLGTAKLGLDKVREARSCFERALQIESDFYLAMYNLGRVLHAMGEKTASRDYFYRIVEQLPGTDLARDVQVLLDTLK